MASITDLFKMTRLVDEECILFDPNTWFAWMLVIPDYYPYYLSGGLYAISLFKSELYLALLSLCLTLDWGVSVFFQMVLFPGLPNRFENCGARHQMPSFSTENILLFEVMLILYTITWPKSIRFKLVVILKLGTTFVIFSRIYLGVNTTSELLAGTLVAVVEGIVYHWIIYYWLWPYFSHMLNFALIKWFGIVDSMCLNSEQNTVGKNAM